MDNVTNVVTCESWQHCESGIENGLNAFAKLTAVTHYIIGVVYFMTGFIGIGGQVWTVFYLRKINFLTPTRRILHDSLALANCSIVAGFPLTGTSCFAERWLFGAAGCQLYGVYGMTAGLSSIFLLLALTTEHCLHCRHDSPSSHKGNTRRRCVSAAVLAWCGGLFWALLPFFGWASYGLEPGRHSCTLNWRQADAGYTSYLLTVTLLCYAVPFSCMALCLMKAHSRSRAASHASHSSPSQDGATTKLLACLAGLAVVTWTPYALLCLNSLFSDPRHVATLTSALPPLAAKVVTCFVPLVYYVFVRNIEKVNQNTNKLMVDLKEAG